MRKCLALPRELWIENFGKSWFGALERKGPCSYVCTDGSARACGVGVCTCIVPTLGDPWETSGPQIDTDADAGDGDLALVRAREGSVATDAPVDATQRCLLAALRGHDRGGPCVLDVDPEGAHVILTDRGRAACLWAYGLDLNPREVGKTDIRAAHWPVTNETALFRGPYTQLGCHGALSAPA